jgi:hypothetical protein
MARSLALWLSSRRSPAPAEDDGVVADDVAAPQGVDAHLAALALARDALAAVAHGGPAELALLEDDLEEPRRRAAWRVLLHPVVHLHDLGVVVVARASSRPGAPGRRAG